MKTNKLTILNGKTIDKIYQVDFNKDRYEDIYLPWLFFITFLDFDEFLEIEGDFDGVHIKISFNNKSELNHKIKGNHLSTDPDLWQVYDTKRDEAIGQVLGQKIEFLEYGIDKDEFKINGTLIKGQKDLFNFIRFNCENVHLTIFESALGLGVSNDKNVKLNFEETFEKYDTK